MKDLAPIRSKELFSLKNIGINLNEFKRESVRMESDKYITAREKNEVVIVNVANPNVVERIPSSVEVLSVIMHPTRRILAFETIGNKLAIYDLERNIPIKSCTVKRKVDFWTWINSNTIGFVTKTWVHHWNLDDNVEYKVFHRHLGLRSKLLIITDYRPDSAGYYFLLVGVEKSKVGTYGYLALHKAGKAYNTQLIDAHAACFAKFKMEGNPFTSDLICYSLRKSAKKGKLTIKELETDAANRKYTKKSFDFVYSDGSPDSFPLSMQASSTYGILYMITNHGHVQVFEIETGCSIYTVRISTDPIFITTRHTFNNGFLAITEYGTVFSVCLDKKTIIPYVTQKLQNPDLALKLSSRLKLASESMDDAAAKPIPMPWRTESSSEEDKNVDEVVKSASRCKIPTTSRTESSSEEDENVNEVVESASRCNISDDDVVRKFDLLIKNGDYHEAAKLAATAPKNILRTPQTLQKLKEATPSAKATHSLVIYFTALLEQGSLNKYESLELCRPVLVQGKKQLVEKWISEGKLECSEELGDLVKQYDVDLATSIYLRGNVPYKVYRSLGDVLREHSPTRSSTGSSSGEDQNSSKVGPNEWVDFK